MLSSDRMGMTPCPLCKSTMMCKANVPYISQVITHILALCGIICCSIALVSYTARLG